MSEFHSPLGLVDASLGARLAAFWVDAALGVVACMPGVIFGGSLVAGTPTLLGAILLVLLVGVQTVLLTRTGQTLGKRAVRIQIVCIDTGRNGGFVTNVLKRTVLNWLLSVIPFYSLVDTAFIFRRDRRCIHDHIAGTRVIERRSVVEREPSH